jgi:hypothetical protein
MSPPYISLGYTGSILIDLLFHGAVLIPVIRPTKVKDTHDLESQVRT